MSSGGLGPLPRSNGATCWIAPSVFFVPSPFPRMSAAYFAKLWEPDSSVDRPRRHSWPASWPRLRPRATRLPSRSWNLWESARRLLSSPSRGLDLLSSVGAWVRELWENCFCSVDYSCGRDVGVLCRRRRRRVAMRVPTPSGRLPQFRRRSQPKRGAKQIGLPLISVCATTPAGEPE